MLLILQICHISFSATFCDHSDATGAGELNFSNTSNTDNPAVQGKIINQLPHQPMKYIPKAVIRCHVGASLAPYGLAGVVCRIDYQFSESTDRAFFSYEHNIQTCLLQN
jgi:hypothetical protein